MTRLFAVGVEIYHDVPFEGFNIDLVLVMFGKRSLGSKSDKFISNKTSTAILFTPGSGDQEQLSAAVEAPTAVTER